MTYKTIVAVLDVPRYARQVSDFAIFLADACDAHLIGLHAEAVTMTPVVMPMEIPDPVTIQALQDMAHEETLTIEQQFRQRLAANGATGEWRSLLASAGYNTSGVIETARCADLIIAAQGDPKSPEGFRDLDGFLFESGRPVLMVPNILSQPKPFRRVLIAWNGSREATRATFDALPFLKKADEVEIFTVDPDDTATQTGAIAGAEIAATLARHGVKATLSVGEAHGMSRSAVIENRLSDSSIDLLVMGAYTHSRLWQMLFGGTTKTLLESMTALTLLSR